MDSLGEGQASSVPPQPPYSAVPPQSLATWDWGCLKGPFGAENFALTACGVSRGFF